MIKSSTFLRLVLESQAALKAEGHNYLQVGEKVDFVIPFVRFFLSAVKKQEKWNKAERGGQKKKNAFIVGMGVLQKSVISL